MASSSNERLEDVFQDEIIKAFVNITSFEKFARSKNGLCLDQADIQIIVEDHGGNLETQKLEMLFKWREIQGEKATVPKIRHLLQKYFKRDNSSDYIVLGNGLFGVYKTRFLCKKSNVYLGVQISEVTGTQTRAIKFVPKNEKNLREAQILIKLGNHVNVVSIIHAGTHHGDPYDYIYIAMEHSWTQTVRNMIEECIKLGKPFHEFIAWSLVEQLMRAVEFLHSFNIIHRDVKPDNVLASDDWKLFKLTDYGISKEMKDGSATIQTNSNTGTNGYRCRETYDPNAKITAKVDVFSAGVTIGEIMANGTHPFGGDPDLWSYNIKNNKNLDLSYLCVSNKDQAISLIKQMLEMDPEKRPTAKKVLNDVSRHFQTFQLINQQTTADELLVTTSKAITELTITEKGTKTNVQEEANSTEKIPVTVPATDDVQLDLRQFFIHEDEEVQQQKHEPILDNNDQRSSVTRSAEQQQIQEQLAKPPQGVSQMPCNRTSQEKIPVTARIITTAVPAIVDVQFDEGQSFIPEFEEVQQQKCELVLDNNDQRSSVIRPAVQQQIHLTKPPEEVLQMPCNRTSQGEKVFVYHSKSEDFGQASDPMHSLQQTANNDMLTVFWKPPAFDNHPSDYKVEEYELEIRKVSGSGSVYTILFSKDVKKYQLSDIILDHGSTYEVLITTKYTDTAQNSEYKSQANRLKIQTRPCQPKIIENAHHDGQLKIRWTFCKGAKYYTIEIVDKDSDKHLVHESTDTRCSMSYKFDKIINFGTSYYAIVTAINAEEQTNSTTTEIETIEKLASTSRSTWLSGMLSYTAAWVTGLFSSGNVTKLFRVNQRWTAIDGWTHIEYNQASRYRKGSKVFNARRKSGAKDQETVVKFVTDFNIEDKEIIEKLKREIDNHWDTHFHKNVVTYFQSGDCKYKDKDAFFILIEKCDRKTLSERIKEENLPYIKRAKTVKCIAQGLQHLKGRNILHRDLKPQNILYKGDDPKISDFGLSKKIPPNKSHTHQSLEFCGTAGWGAPETYSKNAEIFYAADIYSAGLVFFFALTNGIHPYGDDPKSWHTYIKDDKDCNLQPLYDTPDGIVAYDLISLMLSRDPKHRPTIEEVLEHPFFWDVTKRKNFYYAICSTIEFHSEKLNESRIFTPQTAKYWKKVETEKENWIEELKLSDVEGKNIKDNFGRRELPDVTVQEDVMKGFAKNRPNYVTSMVCLIRNRFEHSSEDKREGKIDLTDEQLWEFFNSRYPYLFIHTYYASKEYYKTKPARDPDNNLETYFPLVPEKILQK